MEENSYCIVLNVAEVIGFDLNNFKNDDYNDGLILKVSLNCVVFELEGNFKESNLISINSKCIWECELADIKRIKTDNHPVKLECFMKNDYYSNGSTKRLGFLLLSLRGVKILNSLSNLEIKPHWYKLTYLSPMCRQNTPQVYLLLAIVKKSILKHINLEDCLKNNKPSAIESPTKMCNKSSNITHTLSMLQSQYGIFVKLLEDVGQIQVGNDPRIDCDIFCVTLNFHQIKNILSLLNIKQILNKETNKRSFIFQYDFLGSISNVEIVLNVNDYYTINQKISLIFRSSLKSLQKYFQRIFYIPIHLYYMNDIAIAKYNFDISSFLPDDIHYFNKKGVDLWTKYGSFYFDILCKRASPSTSSPVVEFMLTLELLTKNVQGKRCDILSGINKDTSCYEIQTLTYELKDSDLLPLQQSEIDTNEVQCFHSCEKSECETNQWVKNSLRTIAVNTDDRFETQEKEAFYLNLLKQFNDWKQQQIIYFFNELGRTKEIYMQDLKRRWDDRKHILIARLETKMIKCDHLLAQLENTQIQLNNVASTISRNATIAHNIKQEIESSYMTKISQLEKKIQCLIRNAEVKDIEIIELKKHINQLEKKLAVCQSFHLPIDQLKDILNDMHNQINRFAAIEYFYTEEWSNEMNKWKNKTLKLIDGQKITNFNVNFGLEEILNEDIKTQNLNRNKPTCSSDDENFL